MSTMRREEDGTNYPNYLNGCKFQISQNYLLSQYTTTTDKTQEHLSSLQKCPEWVGAIIDLTTGQIVHISSPPESDDG